MNTLDSIRYSLKMSDMICQSYLDDLTDADLLARPVNGANHINWQIGHLLTSQNAIINGVTPGALPDLPEGFADRYTKETAASDDAAKFDSKSQLLDVYASQLEAFRAAVDKLTDDDLDRPAPQNLERICQTVGEAYAFQPVHWLMHVGQWAVTRRKLGRPPLF